METCANVGDVAEDRVEGKEALDGSETGEVVETDVLMIAI